MTERRRFAPRKMELSELVRTLVGEHALMREGIVKAKASAAARDYEAVRRALEEIDPVFKQHIADEEAQILGLLVAKLGVKRAQSDIAVFRQHRPIYNLMERISELAEQSSTELEMRQSELDELFEEHARLEETQVFPKATTLSIGSAEEERSG
jgi:hemerythrin-like domain-containing protein